MKEQRTTGNDELLIRRCFDLAQLGAGKVSPNPVVGAVLVHAGRIIGEGWHQKYGEAHAEVNCVRSVSAEDQHLIPYSTLYCSLEPCYHFGKTPPCVDLVLEQKIPRVVISNTDPNPKVAGRTVEKLRQAGVEVFTGVLETEGRWLNRAFFTWVTKNRPYIVLKWAQSDDGFLGRKGERTPVSGRAALRLVHKWRSEADAILVGTQTALTDNPRLDTRYWFGKKPLRIVFDKAGKIPEGHNLLDDAAETWVFGPQRSKNYTQTQFFPVKDNVLITDILDKLVAAGRAILLVEGGANVLHQFLENGLWDEIRIIKNSRRFGAGLKAPAPPSEAILAEEFSIANDVVQIFQCKSPEHHNVITSNVIH